MIRINGLRIIVDRRHEKRQRIEEFINSELKIVWGC